MPQTSRPPAWARVVAPGEAVAERRRGGRLWRFAQRQSQVDRPPFLHPYLPARQAPAPTPQPDRRRRGIGAPRKLRSWRRRLAVCQCSPNRGVSDEIVVQLGQRLVFAAIRGRLLRRQRRAHTPVRSGKQSRRVTPTTRRCRFLGGKRWNLASALRGHRRAAPQAIS